MNLANPFQTPMTGTASALEPATSVPAVVAMRALPANAHCTTGVERTTGLGHRTSWKASAHLTGLVGISLDPAQYLTARTTPGVHPPGG